MFVSEEMVFLVLFVRTKCSQELWLLKEIFYMYIETLKYFLILCLIIHMYLFLIYVPRQYCQDMVEKINCLKLCLDEMKKLLLTDTVE